MGCVNHKDSHEKLWLPAENGLLRLHSHCEYCGLVKNTSTDKAKGIGYFENILSKLKKDMERKKYRISQAQIRLIIKEFEELELYDTYSNSFSRQRTLFSDIVTKYVKVSRDTVLQYL